MVVNDSSSINIKHVFGENVVAIVERLDHNFNQKDISADEICIKILTKELSDDEVYHLKCFNARMVRIGNEVLLSTPPIVTEPFMQDLLRRYYLAEDLRSFENVLDEWNQVVQKARAEGDVDDSLVDSSLKSLEVVRKVGMLYNDHWETRRKAELALIADDLQRALIDLKNPIEKVEKILRGRIGIKEVDYYIVDNKFPSCSARRWGGQRWIVGWSDPPEMAIPEVVVQVVSDEVSHWILEEPFIDERRSELIERLRGDLEKLGSKFQAIYSDPQRLLQGVTGAGMVLMEGYGHAFIGFPWMRDEVPVELPTPRKMGREDTLYAESFHFTTWFHDHWNEFLDDPTINAKDWAWQCVNENIDKFIEIAVKFLERGTIYEHQIE